MRALRWIKRSSIVALVLAVIALVVYVVVLPMVVRHVALGALRDVGLNAPTLEVSNASYDGLQIVNMAEGSDRLHIGSINVTYRPGEVTKGRVQRIDLDGVQWRVTLGDGKFDIAPFDQLQLKGGGTGDGTLPFEKLRLRSALLIVELHGIEFHIPIEATVTRGEAGAINLAATIGAAGLPVHVQASLKPSRAGGVMSLQATARGAGINIKADGSVDPATGRVDVTTVTTAQAMNDKSKNTERPSSVTLTSKFTRADGRNTWSFDVDGRTERLSLGPALGGLRIEGIEAGGTVTMGNDGRMEVVRLDATAKRATWRDAQLQAIETSIAQDGPRLVGTLVARTDVGSVRLSADLSGEGGWTAFSKQRTLDLEWEIVGGLPSWLTLAAETMGVVIEAQQPVTVSGAAHGVAGGKRASADKQATGWVFALSELRIKGDGIDAHAADGRWQVEGLHGDVSLAGTVSAEHVAVGAGVGSSIGFRRLTYGQGESPMHVDATTLNVAERPADASFGLMWQANKPQQGVQVASFLTTAAPVQVTQSGVAATLGQVSISAAATVGAVDADGKKVGPRSLVRLQLSDGRVAVPSQQLSLDAITADVPIATRWPRDVAGAFQVGSVMYRKQAFNKVTGDVAVLDGGLKASARWQPLQTARVEADATILLTGHAPTGQITFDIPAFELNDADRDTLAKVVEAMNDLHVEGQLAVDGRITVDAHRLTPDITVTTQNATIRSKEYDAAVEGLTGSIQLARFDPVSTPGEQRFTIASARLGELELNDGLVTFRVDDPDSIFIERTRWSWGKKGTFWLHAFRFKPSDPTYDVEVFVENLNVNQWVKLISNDRASGSGLLYGRIPITYRPNENPRLAFGRGFLYAQPEPGTIQVSDGQLVADLLVQSDSRFVTDANMATVKERIVEALKDFKYDRLAFDFIPRKDDLQLKITTSGTGTGPKKVPIGGLTVNLNGYDKLLNDKLFIKLGSEDGIENALERFFAP